MASLRPVSKRPTTAIWHTTKSISDWAKYKLSEGPIIMRGSIVVSLVAAAVAWGQATNPSPSPAERLKPMAFLVGTWSRDAPAADKPSELFEVAPMYNGNFLRMKTTMSAGGKVVWTDETTYGWDEAAKSVFGVTLGHDGSVGRAVSVGEVKDGKVVFEGTRTKGETVVRLRASLERVDAETMQATIEVFKDGGYRPLNAFKYKRLRPT